MQLTGWYRGASHERSNLMMWKALKVPFLFEQLRYKESHLIALGLRSFPGLDVNLICQGRKDYVTMGCGEYLVFKDSRQFIARSLETIASNLLLSGKELFNQLRTSFQIDKGRTRCSTCCSRGESFPTSTLIPGINWPNQQCQTRRVLLAPQEGAMQPA